MLAPYLLTLPAGLWLLVLFLIPLVVMLSLSLQTCNPATGACVMTWHWGEFGQQLSLYHTQFVTSIYFAGAATPDRDVQVEVVTLAETKNETVKLKAPRGSIAVGDHFLLR